MHREQDGVWEYILQGQLYGWYYGYRIDGPKERATMFDPSRLVADPYARAVVTQNHYSHPAKSLIMNLPMLNRPIKTNLLPSIIPGMCIPETTGAI